jgi:choline dehydrogenase
LKPESSGAITVKSANVYDKPVIDPKYGIPCACPAYTNADPDSFFASENDMNVLIRGVRFSMRIGRTNCVKGIIEPKADSNDIQDRFYMGDADPDQVHLHSTCLFLLPQC